MSNSSTKEIKVTFNTLTPLWTGDAWGDNREIRPSSIMGSLRFWFEVICYFAGITNNDNYKEGKLNDDLNEKKFKEKLLKYGADFEGINKVLAECEVSLPSRVFGCTGWKGWIRIKDIRIIKSEEKYDFPIGKIKFNNLRYSKKCFNKKNNKEEEKEIIPAWYFPKGFLGKFEIIFEIENKIIEPIFYPLLKFIEKYGFLGGKWNIGYGRVEVEKIQLEENKDFQDYNDWIYERFGFSNFYNKFSKEKENFSSFLQETSNWDDLENNKSKVIFFNKNNTQQNTYRDIIIKELIKIKASHRHNISNSYKRHNIFGEGGKNVKGTKILPWIYKEGGQLKDGFVSIAGILEIGGINNDL